MGTLLPANTFAGVSKPLWVTNGSEIRTNVLYLDDNAVTATPTVLALNGIPVGTTQNLSTIMDWSFYPAFSTINGNNNDMANVNKITTKELSVTTLAPRPEPGVPADEVLVGANLFFAGTTGIRDAEEVDTYQLKTNGIQAQSGFGVVTFNSPITMSGNNITSAGILNATELQVARINAPPPYANLQITTDVDFTGHDANINVVNATQVIAGRVDANSVFIAAGVNPGVAMLTTNVQSELLVNGNLPVVGDRDPIDADAMNIDIEIPGMTPLGLVQLTYFALNGNGPDGPQTFRSVNYGVNNIVVLFNRPANQGDSINWSVIRY
jgi:hypothetical protein